MYDEQGKDPACGKTSSMEQVCCDECGSRLKPDGRVRVLWQVQPDGRCWADEGGRRQEAIKPGN